MKKDEFRRFNTTTNTDERGLTTVVYYKTAIVKFDKKTIVLNTGGWWTVTTQSRMNAVSRHYDLGYRVHRVGDDWYVAYQGHSHAYKTTQQATNLIQINRETGEVTPGE